MVKTSQKRHWLDQPPQKPWLPRLRLGLVSNAVVSTLSRKFLCHFACRLWTAIHWGMAFQLRPLMRMRLKGYLMHASDIQIIGVDSKLQQWYYWGQAWVSEVSCFFCCCMKITMDCLCACQQLTAWCLRRRPHGRKAQSPGIDTSGAVYPFTNAASDMVSKKDIHAIACQTTVSGISESPRCWFAPMIAQWHDCCWLSHWQILCCSSLRTGKINRFGWLRYSGFCRHRLPHLDACGALADLLVFTLNLTGLDLLQKIEAQDNSWQVHLKSSQYIHVL